MKYLSLFFCAFFFSMILTSCDKSSDTAEYIGTSLDIYVQNSEGKNLLEDVYSVRDIKLYYLDEGKVKEVYNKDMDTPRNLKIVDIDNSKVLRVFANLNDEAYPITYIEWNNKEMDTLKCHYHRSENNSNIYIDSVWYNGEKMFPDHAFGPTGGIKIVK